MRRVKLVLPYITGSLQKLNELMQTQWFLDVSKCTIRVSNNKNTRNKGDNGNSLAVQWLRLRTSTAGGVGSFPGWGTRILHTMRHGQEIIIIMIIFVIHICLASDISL